MAVSTKKASSKAKKGNAKKAAAAEVGMVRLGTERIPLGRIVPSPFQPRQEISVADLEPLARAMAAAGFLGSIWVRKSGEDYELLDGERRWRAAKIAAGDNPDLESIPADVFEATDAQARHAVMLSFEHREDLSPIERATFYQKRLDAGDYPDQKSLAADAGVDQSTVSNLLRLLKLPDSWQQRIISREISERHARALLPYSKYMAIAAAFDEFFHINLDVSENSRELPSVSEWEEETVPKIVRDATRTMDGMHGDRTYYHPRYGRVSIFEPDAFQEKQLKIIKLGDEHLATNVELWEELQAAHVAAEAAARKDEGGRRKDESQDDSPETASAAVIDGIGVEDLEEEKEEGGRIKDEEPSPSPAVPAHPSSLIPHPSSLTPQPSSSAFYRWKLAWMRKLIAEELTHASLGDLVKIVTLGLCAWGVKQNGLDTLLDEALRSKSDPSRRKSLAANLLDCGDMHLENVLAFLVADWFWNSDRGPSGDVPAEDVELLIQQLEIDLETEWGQGDLPALRSLFDLYDQAGLCNLAKRWKVAPTGQIGLMKRETLITKLEEAIAAEEYDTLMPPEVAKAKAGK